jgi:hypothetical protein
VENHLVEITGHPPREVAADLLGQDRQELDEKRAVSVKILRLQSGRVLCTMTYETKWERERNVTRGQETATLGEGVEALRVMAESVLPLGAGYPVSPQFADRQAALKARMTLAAMHAISQASAQAIDR